MSVPKSSKEKNLSPNNKEELNESWLKRIDYWKVIQRAGNLFWDNKKRLITIAILLVLTGGQVVTFNSSFSGNMGGGDGSNSAQDQSIVGNEDWRNTLDKIESGENLKIQARNLLEDKEKLYSGIAIASFAVIFIMLILVILFFLNCHFHLLFINTVKNLDLAVKKNKSSIKREIRGRWKKLALMRVIFGLIYLGCLTLFMLPAAFFAWQKSWVLAITMGGFSLLAIFIVFMMISYVFRYSLFYLALGKLSIKKSVDCGYDVFSKFWKESIMTSLVNFALGIIAAIGFISIFFVSLLALAIIAALVGLVIYLVAGMAHAEGIAIGVGITLVLIPLIIIGIILAAVWHGFVVIFWYLVFSEIAGCKLPEPAKEVVLVKTKKKPAPVIQKIK